MQPSNEHLEHALSGLTANLASIQKEKRSNLRDMLAMAALTGILSNKDMYEGDARAYALAAYAVADAMLTERERVK